MCLCVCDYPITVLAFGLSRGSGSLPTKTIKATGLTDTTRKL